MPNRPGLDCNLVPISCTGGLPEAGLGVCPVCSVQQIEIPPDSEGTPCWANRHYPKQDMSAWVTAITAAARPDTFANLSQQCRRAAHDFVDHAQQQKSQLLVWLEG